MAKLLLKVEGRVYSIFNFLLSIMERKGEICDRSYLNTKHIKIGAGSRRDKEDDCHKTLAPYSRQGCFQNRLPHPPTQQQYTAHSTLLAQYLLPATRY